MKSNTIKILEFMESGKEVTNVELSKVAGWRFGGYLHNLREYGVNFSKRKGARYIEYWKLESIPKNLVWKGREKLKIVRKELNLIQRIIAKIR